MSMLFRAGALAGAALLVTACGGPTPAPEPSPVSGPPPTTASTPAQASAAAPLPVSGTALTGAQVVEQVCGQCHSHEPPALKAPPLTHLARHLRATFDDEETAVGFVVAWATQPDSARSILPPMARERFGLMPPQPLPPDLLDAAARYIWALGPSADGEPMPDSGMGMHRNGGGMGMRGGGGDMTMGMGMHRNEGGRGMEMQMERCGHGAGPAAGG